MYLVSVVRGSKGPFVPADDYPGDELEIFNHPHYPRFILWRNRLTQTKVTGGLPQRVV